MNERILPADEYVVINKSIITENDKKILQMLYLPIIGPIAISLYNIFLDDLLKQEIISQPQNHAHLLSNLQVSVEELSSARNTLEGIGLLKTYFKQGMVNSYIYELFSPVSAHEFFSHPIFNIVLYNNVGKNEYEKLVAYFKMPKINKDSYKEITHSFTQVFKSVPSTSYDMYKDNIRKYNKLKLNIDSSFDMNFLINSMPKQIDKKIFTKDLQELIIQLAFLYDIDATKMQNIIKSCINEKGTINREELRKVARNHYKFDHSGVLPTITLHTQPEYLRKPIGDNSNWAKMVYTFETTSPYDFLKSKSHGAEPVKRDIKLVEDLLVDYGLYYGVINVLIDYVLRTNDNKLNRKMVETIAGQWKRKNIETVEEAMEFAKKTHNSRKTSVKVKNQENVKADPSWFDKEIQVNSATDEEREMIDELLKEYR